MKANLYGSATTETDETIETGGKTEEFKKEMRIAKRDEGIWR
jgi:hypothetical protein